MTLGRWRAQAEAWTPEEIPTHPDLGVRYPWQSVALHAFSRSLQRKIDHAYRVIADAAARDVDGWRVGLSCGKDSTALALLAGITAASVATLPFASAFALRINLR